MSQRTEIKVLSSMGKETFRYDEPLTPLARHFVQPQIGVISHSALTCEQPLDVDAIRELLKSSPAFSEHPRLCSLLATNSSGHEIWQKTLVNLDDHLTIHHHPISDNSDISEDDVINDYVADLCVTPLPTDKPLWDLHLLMSCNTLIFRFHHAIGDGISIVSLLLSLFRRLDDPSQPPSIGMTPRVAARRWWHQVWKFLKVVWYFLVYVVQFALRALWVRDEATVVRGGAGLELWPRRLATARFRLEDMKLVKGAVAKATINDVLLGIVSIGLSRYLEIRSSEDKNHVLHEGLQITGVEMVNVRREEGLQEMSKLMDPNSRAPWGNKFVFLLFPIRYHAPGSDPIQSVKIAKSMIENKRLPLKTRFSYKLLDIAACLFGSKLFTFLIYHLLCNTSFTISNVMGPREKISIAGNAVKYFRATTSNIPQAIVMHFVSYAGVADMQIQVAKDIIPDPKVLAKCFEDALMEMKKAVEAATGC